MGAVSAAITILLMLVIDRRLMQRQHRESKSAIRLFLKQSVMRGCIPFDLQGNPYLVYPKEADAKARTGEPGYTEEQFRAKTEALVHVLPV